MMDRPKRERAKPVRFSPPPASKASRNRSRSRINGTDSAGDVLADGSLFLCEKCGATFLDSRARGVRKGKVVHPLIRYDADGVGLMYCRVCGMQHDRQVKHAEVSRPDSINSPTESDEELRAYSQSLPTLTGLSAANKLSCYNKRRCHCLTKYLQNSQQLRADVTSLLDIWEEASRLRVLKVSGQPSTNGKVGLGNGKKRSKLYEDYVLHHRPRLRNELLLCEPTTQKILGYSNNFLHKNLLTEQRRTRLGVKPRANLPAVTLLWKHKCCKDKCTRVVRTHLNLVARWRQLATENRRSLQQAIAELLTPTAGAKTNCHKFISLVTGCSSATIAKVAKKMKRNGGVLGMHEHGLKKYWREKRDHLADELSDEELPSVWSLPQHHAEEVQLRQTVDKQSKKLEELKSELDEQKKKVEQQQAQLSAALNQKQAVSVLKSPSLATTLKSPPIGSWRSETSRDESKLLTVETGCASSPQYPHRQSSRSLLQPSKLDSALRLQQEQRLRSYSAVTVTSKNCHTAGPADLPPALQAVHSYYGNVLDSSARADAAYLSQHVQTSQQMIGYQLTDSSGLYSQVHPLPPTLESSVVNNQFHMSLPMATNHTLQFL